MSDSLLQSHDVMRRLEFVLLHVGLDVVLRGRQRSEAESTVRSAHHVTAVRTSAHRY